MTPRPPSSRWRVASFVVLGVVGALAVVTVVCLFLVRTAAFQHAVVRYAAARLSRDVEVRGPLELDLLSSTPTLTATDVTLSNPSWMPRGESARIGKLTVVFDFPWPGRQKSILRLEMLSATLRLVRDEQGRANWQWSAPGEPKKGEGVLVRSLSMPAAQVVLDDARRHLQFAGTVTAGDVPGATANPAPLRIAGAGQLNGRGATFSIEGEPLALARRDHPYAFTFEERSGEAQLRGHGRMLRPFNPGFLDAEFAANGASMRELYFLAGMHFPESAPFTLTGKVERRDRASTFRDLEAKFGRSDLRGTVALAIVQGRSQFDADLSSHLLRLQDFGRHREDGSTLAASAPGPLLLPDAQLPLNGLKNRDAVIHYRAETVQSRSLSLGEFSGRATIDRGVLTARDLRGRFRDSHIAGSATIDVRSDVPRTTLDLTMTDLPLAQFAHEDNARPPFEGMLQAHLQATGYGNSVHELAASATGELAMSMSNGAMRASMAEMTAATLRGLGLTLTKSDAETPVRCGVATFRARDGVLSAERIVVDTDQVVIRGAGTIHLDTEALDLTLRGEPRTTRLLRLHKPVSVGGSLKHPSVKLAMKSTASLPEVSDARQTDDGLKCGPALAVAGADEASVKR